MTEGITSIRRIGDWFEIVNEDPAFRSFLRSAYGRLQTETVDRALIKAGFDLERHLDAVWEQHSEKKSRRAK